MSWPLSVPPLPLDGPNTKGWSELGDSLLTRTWKYGFCQAFPQASVKKSFKNEYLHLCFHMVNSLLKFQ